MRITLKPSLYTFGLPLVIGLVAHIYVNPTLIPSLLGGYDHDISTLQGQRVVKLVQHTPPSITTTWAFFNLFEPLELTDDFPDASDACMGHEGCIIRTVTFSDSKPLTIHAIPLDRPVRQQSSCCGINLENNLWARSDNSLEIHFSCNDSVINFIESDILPIEIDESGISPGASIETLHTNVSSNFLGVRQFQPLGNGMSLNLDNGNACSKRKCVCPELSYTERARKLAGLAGLLLKMSLIQLAGYAVIFCFEVVTSRPRKWIEECIMNRITHKFQPL
ncbi:uncharacterized protein V1516DRAFT_65 [Lipomyces oligophaga]|uniref:uncharacterized protein n=1 Tax=Lipomyces oligophaga TaxID=45792 RepID=UPI0034CD432F